MDSSTSVHFFFFLRVSSYGRFNSNSFLTTFNRLSDLVQSVKVEDDGEKPQVGYSLITTLLIMILIDDDK